MTDADNAELRLESPDQINSQIIALMQNAWDSIEFAKTQQWRVAYYALLLFAAIVGIRTQGFFGESFCLRILLAGVAVIAGAFAVCVIINCHRAQWRARARLRRCVDNYLSRDLRDAWDRRPEFGTRWEKWPYMASLSTLTALGALFVVWVVLCYSLP